MTVAAAFPHLREPLGALGSNLRKARQARGWTMAEVAERTMVSLNTYKRMESGDPKVALGSWVRAWELFDLFRNVVSATAPEQDRLGQVWRDVRAPKRVRKTRKEANEYDF